MRHFAGVLVGILLLPAFFALNWAANFVGDQVGGAQARWWLLLLLVVYAVVGALAGILLAWRSVSPIALLLGGVLLIAAEVMLALPVLAGMKLNFAPLYAHPNITDGKLLVTVGVALVFGGFLPTRWHRPTPKTTEEAADDEDRYAGAEILPGGPPADEATTRQMPSNERYDSTWGTGRNEYVDEPEQPYTTERSRQQGADRGSEPSTDSYATAEQPAGGEPDYEQTEYQQSEYEQDQYDPARFDSPDYQGSGYEQAGYEQAGYEQSGYEQSGYEQDQYEPNRLTRNDHGM
ncbi:MAG: hypothetical protein ACRDMV_03080 [Streptosporangiales bacterium]